MVGKIVSMVNLSRSHGNATLMRAHKCVLVHLAHGVHAVPIALVAPRLAPSWSSALLLEEVLSALMQMAMLRQLIATRTIAQKVTFALQCKLAHIRMASFSDDEVDFDVLRK